MLKRNDSYKSTRNCYIGGNNIQYIVVHYTGCFAPVKSFCLSQMNNDLQGSAHDFVGDSEWYCAIDHSNRAWAVGDDQGYGVFPNGITNSNSLNIEMCCCDANLNVSNQTMLNTAEIVAYYMKVYGLGIDRVKRHYDASYKYCPRDMTPYVSDGNSRWGVFLSWVQKAYNGESLTGNVASSEASTYQNNEVEEYEGCKCFLTNEAIIMREDGNKDGIPANMKGKNSIWTIDHFAIVAGSFCGVINGIGAIPQTMYRTVKDTPSSTSEMKNNMKVKLINEVQHGKGSQWAGQRIDYKNYSHTKEYIVNKLAINDGSFEGYINGLGWIPVNYFKVTGYVEEQEVKTEEPSVNNSVEIPTEGVEVETNNEGNRIFRIIAGAFANKENAENLAQKIKEAGFEVFIEEK